MRLKITAIRDKGDLSKERIVMKVESNCDVGEYILIQSGRNNGSVTNKVSNSFWFPDKDVHVGDFVVLYTKSGKAKDKAFNDATSHFFYWGKEAPIWDQEVHAAVLMHAPTWESYIPS
ncbi:hypothetical protein [Aeromonas allosaccharophila]|uniref:hypothetical protein n=1 Tax=Aeromonas allosaccharophila TaxID=656 RepID=UPI003D1C6896